MKVQAIRDGSIALFTDFDELSSRGIHALNGQATADMIRRSFIQLGMDSDGEIDVETYINGRAILIFARLFKVKRAASLLCRFDGLEDLISAAHAAGTGPDAALISYRGAYWLALYTTEPEAYARIFREYGEPYTSPRLRCSCLFEHGEVICCENALEMLCRTFRPKPAVNPFFADSLPASE